MGKRGGGGAGRRGGCSQYALYERRIKKTKTNLTRDWKNTFSWTVH